MKLNCLNEYSMRQATIFDLRNIAREIGVNSPTLYKKEELIAKILKIISGQEKPEFPKSRQGRPPKKHIDENILSDCGEIRKDYIESTFNFDLENENRDSFQFFEDKFNDNKKEQNKIDKDITSNFNYNNFFVDSYSNQFNVLSSPNEKDENKFYQNTFDFSIEERKGYYYELNGLSFIYEPCRVANINTVVFVEKIDVEKYNLKSGNFVEFTCKKILSNNRRYLLKVLKTDDDIKYIPFDDNEIISNSRLLFNEFDCNEFKGKKIINNSLSTDDNIYKSIFEKCLKGSRNIIQSKNYANYFKFLKEIKNNIFKQQNMILVSLYLDCLPEDERLVNINEENVENFYTIITDTEKQNNFTIDVVFQRIKKLLEQGKNVVVLLNSINKIIKYKNFEQNYSINDLKYKSFDSLIKLLSLSRNCSNNKSITIFAYMKYDDNEFCSTVKEQLESLNCNFYEI